MLVDLRLLSLFVGAVENAGGVTADAPVEGRSMADVDCESGDGDGRPLFLGEGRYESFRLAPTLKDGTPRTSSGLRSIAITS
jgi:hypothetical protein